jgi:hypothetical protein
MINRRIPTLLLPFLLLFVLTGLQSRAQLVPNTAVLKSTGQALAQKHAELKKTLAATAQQKGWPLTFRNKAGRLAYLRNIDPNGFPIYVTTTDNIISAATIRTNQLWPGGGSGLNLNGGSNNMKSRIAVWDEGLVRPTHVELTGRVTQVDHSPTLSDHSTHVAGTLIAAGVNPSAKGMSFGAQQLLAYDFDGDEGEMATAAAGGLLVSSHSYADIAGWFFDDSQNRWEFWGNPGDTVDVKFGLYDQDAQIWDSIAYNAPNYLIAKASGNNPGEQGPDVGQPYWRMNTNQTFVNSGARPAGISNNAGYNTIATYGNAKNILTIGAVNPIPGGYNRPSDVVLADFSSLGPSGDGRIKPDLVADGVNVLSSISTADNAYDIYSGTSMATPASAGSSFLLQEYYTRLHGASSFLRAATVKGLLIHTADEAGANPGPDYAYGWGLINMQRAASVITSDNTDHTQLIKESSLTNSSHDTETFNVVASGKTALVATISWTDPPHSATIVPGSSHNFADTARKLINDLDLRITDNVTGKVYLPWMLNPFNRPAAATKGDNIRDNVEKVEAGDSLIPGRAYTITVSHKGTLARNGIQAYSILISGIGGTAACASASTSATGTIIDNLTISNLNYSDPAACHKGYIDETSQTPVKLAIGQTIPFSIGYHTCDAATPTNIAVYIDFNNNGTFESSELVVPGSPLNSGTVSTPFTGSLTIPGTVTTGTYTLMRIIAQDGAPTTPAGCGAYTAGQTQDYRVVFTNPATDVGVTALEYPTLTSCASDSQIVSIRIHNFGATALTSVPVTTVITGGAAPVTLTTTCKDSIPAGGEVVFTYNTSFPTKASTTYTFTSTTSLSGDGNTSNNSNTTSVATSAAPAAISGTATICGNNATQVVLKANTTGVDIPFWYDSPTSSVPIAAGNNTTSTDITANKTYYVGLNDLKSKGGPPNKMVYSNTGTTNYGFYYPFNGQFVNISTSTPLTLESAKLYVGHSGKVTFTLATLASISADNGYSYFPVYSTTIDLYATKQVPQTGQVNVAAGDNTDTGAVYYLNIPIPTPGDYILIGICSNNASLFINSSIKTNPYPITLPGVFSITSNSNRYNPNTASDSVTYFQKFYFPLYDIGIRLNGCPSATRTAVTATTEPSPSITLSGNILTSSTATGNQWYLNDSLLAGRNGQTDTANFPGVYYTSVTDPTTGCILTSNKITFSPGGDDNASIGLLTSPNPSNGNFLLQFFMSTADNTSVTLTNTVGQRVYHADYPGFSGMFNQQINAGYLASGMYILKIIHGGKTYHKKLIIRR